MNPIRTTIFLPRPADWIGGISALLVFAILAWRLTIGVDLSDESYYAIFLDDWLKGDIRSSPFITLHQTAALLIYPLARIYVALRGSEFGLMLFLRTLYLCGAAAAAACMFALLRRIGPRSNAWAGAVLALSFIPFGLPAPSYDTIGMQGLLSGLSMLGCGFLEKDETSASCWLGGAALAFAVMTVAYPPMALVLLLHGVLLLITLRQRRRVALSAALVTCGQALAWGGVILALGWPKLTESIEYLNASGNYSGILTKLFYIFHLIASHRLFAAVCLVAAIVGLWRGRPAAFATSAAMAVLIVFAAARSPGVYLGSNNVVILLALCGLSLLRGLRPHTPESERLVAVLYLTGMIAAGVTSITASTGLVNFCIGGFPAAIFSAAAAKSSDLRETLAITARTTLAAVIFLSYALTQFYGDQPSDTRQRLRIRWGIFAGLDAQRDQAAMLEIMRDRVAPLEEGKHTIAVFGSPAGLILATPDRAMMPIPYVPAPVGAAKAIVMTTAFYEHSPPDLIVDYSDAFTKSVNPIGPHFDQMYRARSVYHVGDASLSVFTRR